jgi:hypothetical protein
MQCIVNKCSQDTEVRGKAGASVSIQTLPLSENEQNILGKLNETFAKTNADLEKSANSTLSAAAANPNMTVEKLGVLSDFMRKRAELTQKSQEITLALYERDINIEKTTIKVAATVDAFVKVVLSTDASAKLASLAEEVSKDVAAMNIANQLGVAAQDPNVKSILNRNMNKSSSTSSSSITNIAQNTKVEADATGAITIIAPGNINLSDTVIDASAAAKIVVQQIMTQAVTNGIDLASKTMNDNQSVQDVLNKVKGLDDYKKVVNEGLRAGTDPGSNFGGGGSTTWIIVGVVAVVVLVLIMMMRGGGGGGGVTFVTPGLKFKPYRL